ncbi:hypothetical protein ABID21_004175 [Pseudorhizobium tarimense]|uniref:Uncharacterized protein n=1 Tax=Pseudorhizobium tarimense TaxID=1079109 RepID=A0ABV2HBW3_9HYPH
MSAMLGKIFAMPIGYLLDNELKPAVFAVVGTSSLAVALIGGPLTMTFLALEITRNFPITALVLAATITSSLVVRTTFGYSFATWRFQLRGESIRSPHDIGWIRNLTVDKLMRPDIKKANASLSLQEFREQFPFASTQRAIIVDENERYVWIVLVPEVYAEESDGQQSADIGRFIRYRNDTLQPQMNARQAATIFDKTSSEALAVVNNLIERRVIGQLGEAHTLRRHAE